MLSSQVVEIDGAFVGVAVRLPDGYKFVAVDARLDAVNGRRAATFAELLRPVRAAYFASRPLPSCQPLEAYPA